MLRQDPQFRRWAIIITYLQPGVRVFYYDAQALAAKLQRLESPLPKPSEPMRTLRLHWDQSPPSQNMDCGSAGGTTPSMERSSASYHQPAAEHLGQVVFKAQSEASVAFHYSLQGAGPERPNKSAGNISQPMNPQLWPTLIRSPSLLSEYARSL